MGASLMQLIAESTFAASVAILIVAAIRKLLRRIGGARVAYVSWLLVPTSQLVLLLPAPSQPLQMTADAIPQLLLGALPTAVSSNLGVAGADYVAIGLVGWASGSLLMLFYVVRRQRAFIRSLGPTTAMPDGTHRSSSRSSSRRFRIALRPRRGSARARARASPSRSRRSTRQRGRHFLAVPFLVQSTDVLGARAAPVRPGDFL